MADFEVKAFMDSLSGETKEKVMACSTSSELEEVIRAEGIDLAAFGGDEDVELSSEELDGVAGGKGFIPSALAAIIMFSSTAATVSAAAAPAPESDTAGYSYSAEDTDETERKEDKSDPNVVGEYLGHELRTCSYKADEGWFDFYYSDGIFEEDPKDYSPHMASVAVSMAHASCTKITKIAKNEYDYSQGDEYISPLLAHLGFEDVFISETYKIQPTVDSVACAIGNKKVMTENGEKRIISITVRSGGYDKEWASNVTLGKEGEAAGFASAANQVVDTYLQEYIDKRSELQTEIENGDVYFWLQGFSRGGATANLAAKRLIDSYQSKGNIVCAYCLEAPMGGIASEELSGSDYSTIHNVINPDDLVPYVAPHTMGFKRYGIDHYIGRDRANGMVNFTSHGIHTDTLSDNSLALIDYKVRIEGVERHLKAMCRKIGKDHKEYMPYKIQPKMLDVRGLRIVNSGKNVETSDFLYGFINNMVEHDKKVLVTREEYSENMEAGLGHIMEYLFDGCDLDGIGDDFKISNAVMSAILFGNKFTFAELLLSAGGTSGLNLTAGTRQRVALAVVNTFASNDKIMQRFKSYPGGEEAAVTEMIKIIERGLRTGSTFDDIVTFAENKDKIFVNHSFVQTSAWLRSYDDWYYGDVGFMSNGAYAEDYPLK